jgi:hypothetical protein
MSQLQQALSALAAADAAGNKEDAQVLADLVRQLQGQEKEAKPTGTPINPLGAGVAGVIGGQVLGPMINKGYAAMGQPPAGASAPGAPTASGGSATPGQKYKIKTGYGAGEGSTVREVVDEYKSGQKSIGTGKITKDIPRSSPLGIDPFTEKQAAEEMSRKRAAEAMAKSTPLTQRISQAMPGPVQKAGQFISGAASSGVAPYLGRSIAGAGTAVQGADAYNRLQQGDVVGGGLGALSSLGSAAALVPHPVTRYGGPALAITAEMLQSYIDKQRAGEQKKAQGGLISFAQGGSTSPAWQRSEGKNPEGGLNAAGRASYNRETGGNLKAPQPEGGSRKKSFCARMSGMKKKLTSSETANDPDSRINKSLRKWKC